MFSPEVVMPVRLAGGSVAETTLAPGLGQLRMVALLAADGWQPKERALAHDYRKPRLDRQGAPLQTAADTFSAWSCAC